MAEHLLCIRIGCPRYRVGHSNLCEIHRAEYLAGHKTGKKSAKKSASKKSAAKKGAKKSAAKKSAAKKAIKRG